MKKRHTAVRGRRQLAQSAEQVEEKIRRRAYELYEVGGKEGGHDLDDWLRAESEAGENADRQ